MIPLSRPPIYQDFFFFESSHDLTSLSFTEAKKLLFKETWDVHGGERVPLRLTDQKGKTISSEWTFREACKNGDHIQTRIDEG